MLLRRAVGTARIACRRVLAMLVARPLRRVLPAEAGFSEAAPSQFRQRLGFGNLGNRGCRLSGVTGEPREAAWGSRGVPTPAIAALA